MAITHITIPGAGHITHGAIPITGIPPRGAGDGDGIIPPGVGVGTGAGHPHHGHGDGAIPDITLAIIPGGGDITARLHQPHTARGRQATITARQEVVEADMTTLLQAHQAVRATVHHHPVHRQGHPAQDITEAHRQAATLTSGQQATVHPPAQVPAQGITDTLVRPGLPTGHTTLEISEPHNRHATVLTTTATITGRVAITATARQADSPAEAVQAAIPEAEDPEAGVTAADNPDCLSIKQPETKQPGSFTTIILPAR